MSVQPGFAPAPDSLTFVSGSDPSWCRLPAASEAGAAKAMEGSSILERMAACLPCTACGSRSSWQLWPGDFDEDAEPILTAPTPALAECLIPPSVSSLYADREQSTSGVAVPWDTGVRLPLRYHACVTSKASN